MTLAQEGTNKHTNKRILVLGSAPHTQLVTAYAWDNLPEEGLNVADYDVAILNLEPLWDEELSDRVDPETLPSMKQFARLLFARGSEIIIIGSPQMRLGGESSNVLATWWLPTFPKFSYESGEGIHDDIDPEFTYYFKYVRGWSYFATSEYVVSRRYSPHNYLRLLDPQANLQFDELVPSLRPIAQTRFQQPIAFKLRFQIVRNIIPNNSKPKDIPSIWIQGRSLKESGHVIWLPGVTKISDYDVVNLILKERYGLQFEQAPPNWVAAYKLPEQIPIEEEISHHEQEIQRLKND